ncbi:S-layer homology domain-containing protein [Aedoeadaptatus pacaensis]|uniref:S-layer homology domain-containing protein n=1 Tax=Aedoeadaptatus pacaensis TaxID=1776390 RepID=UPI000AD6DD06|nr:S-layer homology domain-containing protein [Peptoniphilus pacaensis]
MKSKTKLLSLLLTLAMLLSTFGNTAYAVSQYAKETSGGYEELQGKIEGGREVFSFNVPENKTSVRTLRRVPRRAPAQWDTAVELKATGLGGKAFDWDALPNKSFDLVAKWTTKDGQEHKKKVGPITEAGTKEFNIGWPTDGTMVDNASLEAEYQGNIKIRVDFSSSTAPGSAGKLHFRIRLTELANPIVNVKYVDPYGKALKAEDLPTGNMPNITADNLTDVSLPLPAKDAELNVRTSEDIDDDQLNEAVDGVEYKVDGKGNGDKITLGDKEYKIALSEKNPKEPATISLVYGADVLVPDRGDDGKYPDVPEGYVRLTFKADQVPGKREGKFNDLGEKIKVIDVKEGLKYNNQALQKEIAKLKPIPTRTKTTTPDNNRVFESWTPDVPKDDTVVTTAEYTAKYGSKYSNKDVIPYVPADKDDPTKPDDPNIPTKDDDGKEINRDNYVIVAFKVSPDNSGTLTLGKEKEKPVISALVKKDTAWEGFTMPTTNNANSYVFWHWDDAPADKVADGQVRIAKFIKSGDEIQPGDPKLPDGFFKVTVSKGEGVQADSLFGKTYAVKKDDTLAKDKFPTLKAEQTFSNPKWYNEENAVENNKPEEVAITGNTTFLAKADKKVVIIPDDQDNPGKTPEGYVRVTFAPGTDGAFGANDKKVFDVLKGKTIQDAQAANPALTIPTVTANTGKEWAGWTAASKDYAKDLTDYTTALNANVDFTAKYTDKKVVIIPDDQDNPGKTPEGYVRVTFAPGTDGAFGANDKKVFDVLKGKTIQDAQAANPALTIPTVTANTGKEWAGWTAASKDYAKDLTDYTTALNANVDFTAKYTDKKVVIIPDDQDNPGKTPEGYVRVTFAPGTDGAFGANDKKVFDVLKGKTIQDAQAANPALTIPTVTANTGKEWAGWTAASKDYAKDLTDYTTALNANVDFTAKYTDKKVVIIPDDQDNPGKTPEGYVRVTFAPGTDGAFGANDKKVFDVLKGKTIQDAQAANPALTIPTVTANTGKEWAGWTAASKDYAKDLTDYTTALNANVDFTAKYTDKKVVIIPDDQDNPGKTPEGYVRVTFAPGTDGAFGANDKKVFDVLKGKTIQDAQAANPALTIPTVTANTGKEWAGWTAASKDYAKDLKDYKTALDANVDFTAKYTDKAAPATFDKANIIGIEVIKDPTKMTYTEGDKPNHDGIKVKLTDKNGNTVEIGKDQLTEYGVTVTPTEKTDLTINDHNGKPFVAKVNGKDAGGQPTELTADGKTNIIVNPKQADPGKSDKPIINRPTEGDDKITGKGKPGAEIVVTDKDKKEIGRTTVGTDGKWSVPVPVDRPLKPGETITATQTEKGKEPATETAIVKGKDNGGTWFIPWTPSTPSDEKPKHETAIHKLYIYGYEDSTFRPEGNMTRAEAAAMIARLQGLDLSNKARPDFMDVRSGWYNAAINAVVNAGYMKGYPDGTFRPDGKITRAEFAQMIRAIDKANTGMAPFADVKGHWAEAAINQAYANDRIAGYPDGTFRPNDQITRAEAVTIFNKLYDRHVEEPGIADVKSRLVEFNDINRGHWAYFQVVEASNTHEFYRTEKGKVDETWVRVLQNWKEALANR